jgi:hypothetical protein
VDFTFEKCKTCGEYGFIKSHHCPPAWLVIEQEVYNDDNDAEWGIVYAQSEEGAAEKYCKELTDLRDGDIITLLVKPIVDEDFKQYNVSCEYVMSFSASLFVPAKARPNPGLQPTPTTRPGGE